MSKPPSATPSLSSSRPSSRSHPSSLNALDFFASSTVSLKSFPLNASLNDVAYRTARRRCYNKTEVPYPLSIDKGSLELYSVDRSLLYRCKGSCSFLDFKKCPPKRCLDLGTGLGDWCIDAAKEWQECTFVGLDIANIQIDLEYVDPSVACRIEWVHGNFLDPLPFDDNEFDYVHLYATALCVPEDKWHSYLDEIYRVLKPGGYVEAMEEDAIFPVLPRWFTDPLRRHCRRPLPHCKSTVSLLPQPEELPHEYALLETLYYAAYESRFVNARPCSIIPGYFSATFAHVLSPPILLFPMPPLAPLPPFPEAPRLHILHCRIPREIPENKRLSEYSLPPIATTVPLDAQLRHLSLDRDTPQSAPSSRPNSARPTLELERLDLDALSYEGRNSHFSIYDAPPRPLGAVAMPAFAACVDSTRIGGKEMYEVFAMDILAHLDENAAYTHLRRMAGILYSAKDAMLDVLLDMAARGDETLVKYGWSSERDYSDEVSRERFELMWHQYQEDMHVRISLWYPMTKYGWKYPRRNPMTKAELLDEDRLRHEILEARRFAKEEEKQPTMRAIRLLVGTKGPNGPQSSIF